MSPTFDPAPSHDLGQDCQRLGARVGVRTATKGQPGQLPRGRLVAGRTGVIADYQHRVDLRLVGIRDHRPQARGPRLRRVVEASCVDDPSASPSEPREGADVISHLPRHGRSVDWAKRLGAFPVGSRVGQ